MRASAISGRLSLVSVDVRPKKDANRINPDSAKDINVAIFSVNGFDATSVNANTVRFGALGTEAAPVFVVLREVDGDGKFDMVLSFPNPIFGNYMRGYIRGPHGTDFQRVVHHRFESD